jgi:glycosyltransferase involved in cell wall biosynthesis
LQQLAYIIAGIIYGVVILVSLIYYAITATGKNKKTKKNISQIAKEIDFPFVSIIIPTYNEENNIGPCLASVRKIDYPKYEIIVSDGGSKDRTKEIAQALADKYIENPPVPEGWIGKNWGCHLGSKEASGELLLFTDADTRHEPHSLKKTVSTLLTQNAGLVTLLPYQNLTKWWEMFTPVIFFLSNIASGGTKGVNNKNKPKNVMGFGQYLLFTREAYDKVGGHKRLKGSIVEDLAFTRVVKRELNSLYYMNNDKAVSTRMYPDSFHQLWEGWTKNLYPGLRITDKTRVGGVIIWIVWALFAPVAIIYSAIDQQWIALALATGVYCLYSFCIWTYWRNNGKQNLLVYIIYPIFMLEFVVLIIISMLEVTITKKASWRGRRYSVNLTAGTRNRKEYEKELGQLETDKDVELPTNVQKLAHIHPQQTIKIMRQYQTIFSEHKAQPQKEKIPQSLDKVYVYSD